MNISYDYYRIFYYVAKYGSVSQASRLLLNSQPNLTRAIRNLEGELGCVLFSRSSRGMHLTPEGERLFRHVRIAVEHIEAAQAELTESTSLQGGTVYLATNETALRCLLLPILKQFRLRYPGVHIHISSHSTLQAVAGLQSGSADLAVATTPTPHSPQLIETPLRTYRSVAVCPPEFTGLVGHEVTLAELVRHPLIALGPDILRVLLRLFQPVSSAVSAGDRALYRRRDPAHGGGQSGRGLCARAVHSTRQQCAYCGSCRGDPRAKHCADQAPGPPAKRGRPGAGAHDPGAGASIKSHTNSTARPTACRGRAMLLPYVSFSHFFVCKWQYRQRR